MQELVERACGGKEAFPEALVTEEVTARKRSCVGPSKKLVGSELTEYCEALKLNKSQNDGCYAARKKINVECFGGGDRKHKRAAETEYESAAECDNLYIQYCKTP